MDVYVWIVLFSTFLRVEAQNCKTQPRCKISRVHSMKTADCYDKDITTFSQCLPSDVEIVDLSHNRIRKLNKEDLKKYSDLKILYLNDNLISVIDKETFEKKDYLHTLDLSLNAITKLPPELFQLPSLKSLYLGQNLNMNIAELAERAKPIISPLFHLDISFLMSEEEGELPDLGTLPSLEKYNISGNKLTDVTTKHFAGLCSLNILDTTNVSIEHEEGLCDCWTVNQWLKNRTVNFTPFRCNAPESDCENVAVATSDLDLYNECVKKVEEKIRKSKVKTILLIVIPIAVIIILSIIIYIYLRRRQKLKRRQKVKDRTEDLMLNNAVVMNKG